jgi:hypothetical protein
MKLIKAYDNRTELAAPTKGGTQSKLIIISHNHKTF